MRPCFFSPIALSLSLLFGTAACSGGTDTINGTGAPSPSPSGSGNGKAEDDDATNPPAMTPSGPSESDGGEVPDPPTNDPDDPTPPASGVDGVIEVPQATGTTAAADFVLSQSKKMKRIDIGGTNLTCPVALSTTQAPFVYVELKNTGTKRALTSLWTASTGTGPANTANSLAIYPGPTPPATDMAREQCLGTVSYSCSGSPCNGWPGLLSSAGDAVEVPPNGSVLVFVQGEVSKTGSFKLSVRTDFLQ